MRGWDEAGKGLGGTTESPPERGATLEDPLVIRWPVLGRLGPGHFRAGGSAPWVVLQGGSPCELMAVDIHGSWGMATPAQESPGQAACIQLRTRTFNTDTSHLGTPCRREGARLHSRPSSCEEACRGSVCLLHILMSGQRGVGMVSFTSH